MATAAQPATVSLPSLEDVTPLARGLACKLAHREADIDDLIQTALFAYHRDVPRHQHRVRDPWALAKTILERAMIAYYYYSYPSKGRFYLLNSQEYKRYEPIDDHPVSCNATEDNLFDQLDLEDYFVKLEQQCGKTARVLAENLITPKDPCITAYIFSKSQEKVEARKQAEQQYRSREEELLLEQADVEYSVAEAELMKKKARRAKLQAKQRQVQTEMQQRADELALALKQHRANKQMLITKGLPRGGGTRRTVRVSHSTIGEAMGLESWQWQKEISKIKDFTLTWLSRHGSVRTDCRTS